MHRGRVQVRQKGQKREEFAKIEGLLLRCRTLIGGGEKYASTDAGRHKHSGHEY